MNREESIVDSPWFIELDMVNPDSHHRGSCDTNHGDEFNGPWTIDYGLLAAYNS